MPRRPTKRTADRIAEECIAVRVRLLNRTITGIYDDALRPLGLTAAQMNVLVVMAKLDSVAPGTIARRLHMEKSTVSRNVDRLRRQGWVVASLGESGRSQTLELTEKGHELIETALPLWENAQAEASDLLGPRDSKSLQRIADAIWGQLNE